jgi:hypothetical protein
MRKPPYKDEHKESLARLMRKPIDLPAEILIDPPDAQ